MSHNKSDEAFLFTLGNIPAHAPAAMREELEAFLFAASACPCRLCGVKDTKTWRQWLAIVEAASNGDTATVCGVCGDCRSQLAGMSTDQILARVRRERR